MPSYRYVSNVFRADTTTVVRFRSSTGIMVEAVRGGAPVDITAVDVGNLAQLYVFVASTDTPPPTDGGGGTPGSGGTGSITTVATKAALMALTGMVSGDMRGVIADESSSGRFTVYGYNGTTWILVGDGGGGGGGTSAGGNSRVLLWDVSLGNYLPVEYRTDTSLPREFIGPSDPADIGSIVGPVYGDRWTPTGIGATSFSSPSGVGSAFDIHEDIDTGWPARPAGYAGGTWIGWTDPTDLMEEGDRFIAIPMPVA